MHLSEELALMEVTAAMDEKQATPAVASAIRKARELTTTKYVVVLAARDVRTIRIRVCSARCASILWCAFRDAEGIGGRDLVTESGVLRDAETDRYAGHVSYNGRVWNAEGKEIAL